MPADASKGSARRSHRPAIGSPANAICAPHFSARSSQRGFIDSIRAIFFDHRQPFSCFSRLIALTTSSKLSQYTRRLQPFLLEKPSISPLLCSRTHVEIVRHSDVERAGAAGDDVRPVLMFPHDLHSPVILSEVAVRGASGNVVEGPLRIYLPYCSFREFFTEPSQEPCPHCLERTPCCAFASARLRGVLRLREKFALRTSRCAQDDRAGW